MQRRAVATKRVAVLAGLAVAALGAGGCAVSTFDWDGVHRDELTAYKQAFRRDVGERADGAVERAALLRQLDDCRVLWLGDDHGDAALHRAFLALLHDLRRQGRELALALEAVGTQDEALVAAFLADGDLLRLRARMQQRWPGSWLDEPAVDAAFYRELLVYARAQALPVAALEPTPRLPLDARDAVIADAVRRAAAAAPQRLLVVVVGQAHLLGHGRLPARVGLPHVAIGATPPPDLVAPARPAAPGGFVHTPSGLLFFADRVGG